VLLELTDAAQLEVAGARAFAGPVQVRHAQRNLLEVLQARRLELLGIEHGHAARQILRIDLAELRGDDDLLERAARLRMRERRRKKKWCQTPIKKKWCQTPFTPMTNRHCGSPLQSEIRCVVAIGDTEWLQSLRRH